MFVRKIIPVSFILLLSACGSNSNTSLAGSTDLQIEFNSGEDTGSYYSLGCATNDPSEICNKVNALTLQDFEPVPQDAMCTEIYGGPETATIKGKFKANDIDAHFSRTNGCEIARWDKVSFLFEESM